MRVFTVLALAGAMMLALSGVASAVDFKATGVWDINFGYHGNRSMYDKDHGDGKTVDPFMPTLRVRPNFTVTASESLSATLMFEIGDIFWGSNRNNGAGSGSGGQLDGDGVNLETRRAYIDWAIPQTPVKLRMGLQGVAFPWLNGANPVMNADVFGVTASAQFTDSIGLTLTWMRPYDDNNAAGDNYTLKDADGKTYKPDSRLDEMDVFLLTVPIKSSAVRATPWFAVGSVGKNSGYYSGSSRIGNMNRGRYVPADARENQGVIWWAGASLELPVVQPFIVKLDGMYGALDSKKARDAAGDKHDYAAAGYFLAAELGYAWSWGKTSFIGWYSSGDDDGRKGSYGTIPGLYPDSGFGMLSYMGDGQRGTNRDKTLSGTFFGTWGAGLQVADVSFVPDLKHRWRAVYVRGTNTGERITSGDRFYSQDGNANSRYAYMITTDTAYIFEWENGYKVSDNFSIGLDFYYAHMDLSKQRSSQWRNTSDPWAAILSFQYRY